MGTTRFRRCVKNWNQKYTSSPIQPFLTSHNTHLQAFPSFPRASMALQSFFLQTSSPRRVCWSPAARFPTPPVQPIHASTCHTPLSFSKHTFRGVGNKTLQDFSREVKTRTVVMWMRGYHTSPRLKSYMPRHRFLYATTCSNTCRFRLVFYEPLCWEARQDRCFVDRGCERCPMSTLVTDAKATRPCWALSEDETDIRYSQQTCPADVESHMQFSSSDVRSDKSDRQVVGDMQIESRPSSLVPSYTASFGFVPPDASCKPRFTFLAR